MTSTIRTVLFDVDDTLLLTFLNGFRKIQTVGDRIEQESPSLDRFRALYGILTFDQCMVRWFPDSNLDECRNIYESLSVSHPTAAIEGVIGAVNQLLERGIQVGVISNGLIDRIKAKLSSAGFPVQRLCTIYAATPQKTYRKPDPMVFADSLTSPNIHADTTIFVDDSIVDYLAATFAGIRFVGVLTGPRRPCTTPCIPSAADVVDYMEGRRTDAVGMES